MQIHWRNILALGLAGFALVLLVKNAPAMALTLSSLSQIGPGHTADEKTLGLVTLGILLAAILALCRILSNKQ